MLNDSLLCIVNTYEVIGVSPSEPILTVEQWILSAEFQIL